jgi:hypothetical protein
MHLPENAAALLVKTLTRLLGVATPGSMAFVRCLPADVVRDLAADAGFAVPNWRIAAVTGTPNEARRTITADVAVEWREDKGDATLLLVDIESAGAGMDGIYSAAREINEIELFAAAQQTAREKLLHGSKGFAQKALSKSRRLSRNNVISPWREFSYLCRAGCSMAALGSALPEIGLWPISIQDKPDDSDLDKSASLAERLLPRQGTRQTAEARVAGLKLAGTDEESGHLLACFLRESESQTRLSTLTLLEGHEEFWLNNLRPGVFDAQTLKEIRWLNWRRQNGVPTAWSGLVADDDNRLNLKLALEDNPQQRVRLEVRWETEPITLAKGAVEYAVEVRAGHDVLAEKSISHSAKGPQKCIFTQDDFGEIEESARFEAVVIIRALVANLSRDDEGDGIDNPFRAVSEDFILCFGESDKVAKSSVGNVYPTLALAAIQVAKDKESFTRLADNPADNHAFSIDAKGYITCRVDGKVGRVFCPKLLMDIAYDWALHGGAPGRWQIKVRADGSAADKPKFIPVPATGDQAGERFIQASKEFSQWLAKSSLGPLAVLYTDRKQINDYINAAVAWWEIAAPRATLINTLEVVAVNGKRIGIIVLPTHPLRVAWQQNFDMLAYHHCYEEGTLPSKVAKLLGALVGAQYPAMLPGFENGETFVFVDSLGFHAVAMGPSDDKEPKATVAMLSCLLKEGGNTDGEFMAPSVGKSAANLMGEEIARYITLHSETRRVRLHALRPGDAMPAARAIGSAIRIVEESESGLESEEELQSNIISQESRAFDLELYPSEGQGALSGRFLSATAELRRSGAGAVPEEDRWLLESVTRPGGVSLPRLAWTRRNVDTPQSPAHLALAFDIFTSRLECMPVNSIPNGALEAHGLALTPERRFTTDPVPRWEAAVSPNPEGEKHPAGRVLSERIVKAHAALLRAVARRIGGGPDDWPVLVTEVTPDRGEMLACLHRLCDWVITVDRHAGIEYFDSPRELERLYDAYLIDCVPERDDLGFLQLITSTSSIDEIIRLLDTALGEMGLSSSPRNCSFLLNSLKAVSGRLALRLVQSGTVAQEMVALALTHTHCAEVGEESSPWLSLKEGFFVPLDDVPELFRAVGEKKDREGNGQRADLLYVTVGRRGGLRFGFIEVKFRRYLKTARSTDLMESIDAQLDASCQRWEKLFGQTTAPLEKMVQRARLARVLRFYARKGRRHTLTSDAFERIEKELSKMAREGTGYALPSIDEQERAKVGLVFCPEYAGQAPIAIADDVWLFGPARLPESRRAALREATETERVSVVTDIAPVITDFLDKNGKLTPELATDVSVLQVPTSVDLLLGQRDGRDELVHWRISVQGNPHLMIVGLPGMGKTHCLIHLCQQLAEKGIAPIVFSYHQDIDEKLEEIFGAGLQTISYAGLGFNPLQVAGDGPLAYMDNVSMLRDNFAAIFPDLGDIQLGRIREAIKQSYADHGWAVGIRGETPPFRSFFDILMADAKPDRGLMTRLSELSDYGMFDGAANATSLLDGMNPTVIQIHCSPNELLQRAFATFVLHNIYQTMFRRGTQKKITHAIIFDEAHRAAKLKLIPTMAKECRKYGLAFVVASQEVRDFDPSLFPAIASYLALRAHEADAKQLANIMAPSDKVKLYTDRIKQMSKFKAWFHSEGMMAPVSVALSS